MLSLNNIKSSAGASQKRKRLGRGNASGRGTYSTKGQKGQKSRSGVSGLKRLGMRQQLLQTPKLRGFKSSKPKNQVISIATLNSNFSDGDIISPELLYEKKLIRDVLNPIKILGKEKLKLNLEFDKRIKMSQTLKEQLGEK